jgi:hypothetical protein
MTTTGQELIESAKEALAFAKGEANECVVYCPNEAIDTDAECPVILVHDTELLA